METNKQRSKAREETEMDNSKPKKEEEILEKIEKNDVQNRESSDSDVQNTSIGVAEETKDSEFEVRPSSQLSESDFQSNFGFSTEHLSEVPVEYSLQPLVSDDELKDHVRVTSEERIINSAGKSAHLEKHDQIAVSDGPSKLNLSPSSIPESISSGPSSTPQEKLSPKENGNNSCLAEQDMKNSSNPKMAAPKPKTSTDGYNWRKYGQKQVKSPEGSRSYYRCTSSDCDAKKIECCDQFGNVIEIVYRSHHNHDPPQKVNCTRESRNSLSIVPANGDNAAQPLPLRAINVSSMDKPPIEMAEIPETNRQETSKTDETVEISTKEEHVIEPELKKRQKKSVAGDMVTVAKPGKKPKTVVEEAGDVGISGDGYRWRKYGQKMVKGNPHPRNYYRCTSAGCPVRKQIERATESSGSVIVSYTGVHDHDMPTPKKTRGPTNDPSSVTTTSPGSINNLQVNETEA